MAILVDTNILLRLSQKNHPHSATAFRAVEALLKNQRDLVSFSQNVVEFWAVATRPIEANGLGLTPERVLTELDDLGESGEMLPELPVHAEWLDLVTKYRVLGKNVHDARLVAAMLVHGIGEILTFNGADFARYAEISVLNPLQF